MGEAALTPAEAKAIAIEVDWRKRMLREDYDIVLFDGIAARIAIDEPSPTRPPLFPLFDARFNAHAEADCFHIVARQRNVVVGTIAGVLRDCPAGLGDALGDLSFCYARSTLENRGLENRRIDAWCSVDCDNINEVRGRIGHLGALWRDPTLRSLRTVRLPLGKCLFDLAVLRAYAQWKPNFVGGLVDPENVEWLGLGIEGMGQTYHGITYCDANWPPAVEPKRGVAVMMHRDRMYRDVLRVERHSDDEPLL